MNKYELQAIEDLKQFEGIEETYKTFMFYFNMNKAHKVKDTYQIETYEIDEDDTVEYNWATKTEEDFLHRFIIIICKQKAQELNRDEHYFLNDYLYNLIKNKLLEK